MLVCTDGSRVPVRTLTAPDAGTGIGALNARVETCVTAADGAGALSVAQPAGRAALLVKLRPPSTTRPPRRFGQVNSVALYDDVLDHRVARRPARALDAVEVE